MSDIAAVSITATCIINIAAVSNITDINSYYCTHVTSAISNIPAVNAMP